MIQIENKTGRVKLDDQVDQWSRRQLAEEMKRVFGADALTNPEFQALTAAVDSNQIDRLEIEINSPGGSVFDGMLIHNELLAMRARGVHVVAIVNVLAASMGSVIAMAASEVQIVPNGQMMIHDASLFAGGNSKDFARYAALLDGLSNNIAGIYAAKTGMTTEECRALMLDETWMDAKKCVALKFADGIFDIGAQNAMLPPVNFLDRLTNPSAPEALEQITGLQARITELETDQATAKAELETLRAEIADKAGTIGANLATIGDLTDKLATAENLVTETAQALVDLQAKAEADAKTAADALDAAKASAAQQAVEIAAAAGIEAPLAIGGSENTKSLYEQYCEIKKTNPRKALAFWEQHKDAIISARN